MARALMHHSIHGVQLSGNVVDVGGGRGASYLSYMEMQDNTTVAGFDLKEDKGVVVQLDFEKDRLPRETASVDHVLMFNILEHIYHYQYLVGEVARIMKDGAKLTGFVPFLVNYHPDPHDYFRYTHEALELILTEAGLKNVVVREVGKGPFLVNFNNLAPSLPRIVAVPSFLIAYFFDTLLTQLRPKIGKRYPLGYLFLATKSTSS